MTPVQAALPDAFLDDLGIRRGKERQLISVLSHVQSMRSDRVLKAAARGAGLRAVRKATATYETPLKGLLSLGILEKTTGDRVRLKKRLFSRNDRYVQDFIEAARRVMNKASRPLSEKSLIRAVNHELKDYGDIRGLAQIILRTMARQPRRSGFERSNQNYIRVSAVDSTGRTPAGIKSPQRSIVSETTKARTASTTPDQHPHRSLLLSDIPDEDETALDSSNEDESEEEYLARILGYEEPSSAEKPRESDQLDSAANSTTPPLPPTPPSPSEPLPVNLAVVAESLRSLWVQTECTTDYIRATVSCAEGRSQVVYIQAKIIGTRRVRALELTSAVAPVDRVPAIDFERLADALTFSKALVRPHKGASYVFLCYRMPISMEMLPALHQILDELAQAADDLERNWVGEDIE